MDWIYLRVARKDHKFYDWWSVTLKSFNNWIDVYNEQNEASRIDFWEYISLCCGVKVIGFDMKANIGNSAFKYVHLIRRKDDVDV